MASRSEVVITLVVAAALCAFAMGITVGYFSGKSKYSNIEKHQEFVEKYHSSKYEQNDDISTKIKSRMNADNIRENLKYFSAEPHIAGSERDDELANHIHDKWKEQGIDDVKLVPYEVLLSLPDPKNPNKVQLLDESGKAILESEFKEDVLRPEDEHKNFIHSFNSYSPKSDVQGSIVYVNYGRIEDFDELEESGISVKDKICIIKYGKIYRGNKVLHAEQRGAIGVILYLDPEEVALNGTDPSQVYPNSWWMPGTAMQRGTVIQGNGDPMTPGYPSIDGVYRHSESEIKVPKIPSQPVGYTFALKLIEYMNDRDGFKSEHANKKIRLNVNNELKKVKSYNVIGMLRGEIEPDRYVLIGNHRDSWGYGAVDATTGTSQLMEVSRVLGELHKEGWSPRRSIIFCSWGAEEFGLIGSYEWVEENLPKLQDRAITYINVDICTSGDALYLDASPLLFDVSWEISKLVNHPRYKQKSIYEVWKARYPNDTEPEISTPGSGSDHAPFTFYAGIPIINMWWRRNKAQYDISIYPAYHTGYETFFLVDKYIDPGFHIHHSCSQMSALLLHRLADSLMIPFNATRFAHKMETTLNNLIEKNKDILKKGNVNFDALKKRISEFKEAAMDWHLKSSDLESKNPIEVRMINDQLMKLERVFIKPDGLLEDKMKRHMIFAPSKYDSYSGGAYPALSDLLYAVDKLPESDKRAEWKKIEKHISDLVVVTHFAKNIITGLYDI